MARPSTYNCNENYFNNIRSQNQAYVLGFIWADGSVNKRSGLGITLKTDDQEVLEFIRKQLQSDAPIRPQIVQGREYSRLSINRLTLTEALLKLGLTSNKSQNNAQIPNINPALIRHFLRGLFDGDGSIWENTGFRANFSGGYNFLVWVRSILKQHTIECNPIRLRYKNNLNSCSLVITGRKNIDKLRILLYSNSKFHLKRKFDRFEQARLHYANDDTSNWQLNGTKFAVKKLLEKGMFPTEISKNLNISLGSARYMVTQIRNDKFNI
jgi:hypothetical protein